MLILCIHACWGHLMDRSRESRLSAECPRAKNYDTTACREWLKEKEKEKEWETGKAYDQWKRCQQASCRLAAKPSISFWNPHQ